VELGGEKEVEALANMVLDGNAHALSLAGGGGRIKGNAGGDAVIGRVRALQGRWSG
jgi:hypothetical protein